MEIVAYLDVAPGETRRLFATAQGAPFRIDVRQSADRRPRLGEVWAGRVVKAAPGGASWFVDLDHGGEGLLDAAAGRRLTEGAMVTVAVRYEPFGDRRAGLRLLPEVPSTKTPGRLSEAPSDPFLVGVGDIAFITGREAREAVDHAVAICADPVAALPTAGTIAIETTRALTAVDVDSGARTSTPAGFAHAVNIEAGAEIARHLSLRTTGGPVVIDFLTMRRAADRDAVVSALGNSFRRYGLADARIAPISRFGLCEALLPRGRRPTHFALGDCGKAARDGLDLLRLIQSAAAIDRGARLVASCPTETARWLTGEGRPIAAELSATVGDRWRLEVRGGHAADVRRAE